MTASFLLPLAVFWVVALALFLYGWSRYLRPGRIYERLADPFGPPPRAVSMPGHEAILKLVDRIGRRIPCSPLDAAIARQDLLAAGFRSENAVHVYYGFRVLSAAALLAASLWLRERAAAGNPVLAAVLVVAGGFAGWSLAAFVLAKLIARRRERLRLSLPDALDLMVISVEAGLGLDQAIQNVSRELEIAHPELSDELGLVGLEMRAGKRRMDALKQLAERTGESEIRKLIAILVQSDRFGTSMGDALRAHSDAMRVRRRQEAEERAGKVGVKLVFPIFFFILPSMLAVSAGPGLLQIFKHLFPMLRNFGN